MPDVPASCVTAPVVWSTELDDVVRVVGDRDAPVGEDRPRPRGRPASGREHRRGVRPAMSTFHSVPLESVREGLPPASLSVDT